MEPVNLANMIVVLSCKKNQASYRDTKSGTYFLQAVADCLTTGQLTELHEVIRNVQKQVHERVQALGQSLVQLPIYNSGCTSNIFF